MSKTDQAFIDAYRRQSPKPSQLEAESPKPSAHVESHAATHGPHIRFTGGVKAPLSQVMQSRRDAAPTPPPEPEIETPFAATQLMRFAWPEVVLDLERNAATTYAGVVEGLKQHWPVLGLVGCRPRSGGTTTTLVLARLLASDGMPVAIIDADPIGNDLAASLGVARHRSLASVISSGSPINEASLHAVDDGVSLLIAGHVTQHPAFVNEAIRKLREAHAAVLIDLGSDPRRLSLRTDALALVHPHDESDAVIEYSCRSLSQSGAPLVGTIQTMAPVA